MDSNDLLSSITDMFSNPESRDKIQGVAELLGSNKSTNTNQDIFGEEMMSLMGRVMQGFNRQDNRIDLLNSIRPYLKEKRAGNIDLAIRLIRLINIAGDFKLKDVSNVSDISEWTS